MDWGRVITALAIAFIMFVSGGLLSLLTLAWKSYKKIGYMEARGKYRQQENHLQFKAIFALIRCARTGEPNGELKDAEHDLNEYLQEQAVR